MKISAYIIAYNEADKIRDCINSILWADEIILIDSHSDDGTSEIAEGLGAKVIHVPFNGYGDLRNQAISHCSHDNKFDHSAIPVRKKNYHFKKLEKKSKDRNLSFFMILKNHFFPDINAMSEKLI